MAALRAVGDPMELRARELSARPRAVSDARAFLAQVRILQAQHLTVALHSHALHMKRCLWQMTVY